MVVCDAAVVSGEFAARCDSFIAALAKVPSTTTYYVIVRGAVTYAVPANVVKIGMVHANGHALDQIMFQPIKAPVCAKTTNNKQQKRERERESNVRKGSKEPKTLLF